MSIIHATSIGVLFILAVCAFIRIAADGEIDTSGAAALYITLIAGIVALLTI